MPLVKRTPEAKQDAAHIWRYIAENNFDAAERWLAEIDKKIKLIAQFPGAGRRRDELSSGLRSYPVGDYLIFYRQVPRGIQILRIVHGMRNLRRMFRRKR
jgi:toxin ParE1/3/4